MSSLVDKKDMDREPTESSKVVSLLFLAVFKSSLSLLVFNSFTSVYRNFFVSWIPVPVLKNFWPVIFLGTVSSRWQNLGRVD